MSRHAATAQAVLILSMILIIGGCDRPGRPQPALREVIGPWTASLRTTTEIDQGAWPWTWRAAADSAASGPVELVIGGGLYRWRFLGTPASGPLEMAPAGGLWLAMDVPDVDALAGMPPLPVLPVDTDAWPDLVSMARALVTPRFGGYVPHWPARPVPVGAADMVSGDVDLAACLREAVMIWNEGEVDPPFVWAPGSEWGVHVAHYAGSMRSPPMDFRITRLDSIGRPLRARISVGDNYDHPYERQYAVRAFSHELAHARLLWGHTPDRNHLLWGSAPPLRADPSEDERRAANLLEALPARLDLRRYRPAAGQ
jgi:hypothetical protein